MYINYVKWREELATILYNSSWKKPFTLYAAFTEVPLEYFFN